MAFRHEVLHIRRQKQRLIDIPAAKILAHRPRLNQTRSELNSRYSDRLLALYKPEPGEDKGHANSGANGKLVAEVLEKNRGVPGAACERRSATKGGMGSDIQRSRAGILPGRAPA